MNQIKTSITLFMIVFITTGAFGQDLFTNPESVVFDSTNERYLVANWADGIIALEYDYTQSHFQQGIGTRCAGMQIVGNTAYISTENLKGFDLTTGEQVVNLFIPGATLDGLAADTSGNLYAVDTGGKIYKIRLSDLNVSLFATGFTSGLQDIDFDKWNNRLIAVEFSASSPGIKAVSLPDATVTIVASPPFGSFDGVCMDQDGNVYVSSNSSGGDVYKYDNAFSQEPVLIASGLSFPAGLCYDPWHDILAVPNFNGGFVSLIPQRYYFTADTTWGWAPLEVQFTGSCDYTVDSWNWDFGDGTTADTQNPSHIFESVGLYDITMNITYGENEKTRVNYNYIRTLADTMMASECNAVEGQPVEITISARNTIPVSRFTIPVEYAGSLALIFDSVSRVGCRTEYFDNHYLADNNTTTRVLTAVVRNTQTTTPSLEPGYGPILKFYFSPPATVPAGRSTTIAIDGYSTRLPQFLGDPYTFKPPTINGKAYSFLCGDVNGDASVNLIDILYMIENLYGIPPGPAPNPPQSGDVNGDGNLNLIDILYLIDFLYGVPPGPNPLC